MNNGSGGLTLSSDTVKSLVISNQNLYTPNVSGSTWQYFAYFTVDSGEGQDYTSSISGNAVSNTKVYIKDVKNVSSICIRIV